ncbi:phospholipid-translocating P-type ATPase [Hesseltinella vesiculosa]|uniref:Phospholipid-transporting ATPase n=1 Tax=Hesseltinella vesiculosa TaxID=101127 RepID=A0A1X2GI09_9FUNG|nr:phospholipid-translocating P-type ATPase [Hesseltinella vesiculosa]
MKGLKKRKSGFPTASTEQRTIYVNMEIPSAELDDYGQPNRTFMTNKIRTAKYTWFTFLPKNLFEQFRGIANLYFLFLVILQMFPQFSTSASPILVILPLAAILILTGAKDAFEDNKRHKTDQGVNKAIAYTLSQWSNVNIPVYKVARWRRWLHSLRHALASPFQRSRPLLDEDDPFTLSRVNTQQTVTSTTSTLNPLPSSPPLSPSLQSPMSSIRQTIRSSTTSFTRVFQRNQHGPYRPGLVPHSVLKKKKKKKKDSPPPRRPRQQIDKRWKRTLWQDIHVGDIVFLRNDDAVPADVVVLSSSEPDGLCYVETQNLDGETNLKIKRGLQATSDIQRPEDCDNCSFYIDSEPPHANLYSYNGVLKWKVSRHDQQDDDDDDDLLPVDETDPDLLKWDAASSASSPATPIPQPIHASPFDTDLEKPEPPPIAPAATDNHLRHRHLHLDDQDSVSHEKTEAITGSNILLRGCVLRNTDWIIGLVLFTGNETKIMLNSGKTPSKRSKMEKATNPHVIANFVLLFVLCLICSIASSIVYSGKNSATYFEYTSDTSPAMAGFLMFWVTLVIYQNIIPISLYISVQIVKTASAYFIHSDIDMYDERLDQPCIPKTWNISDDLGQIEYIFSDKTGTLTQNIMEFRRCTIHGVTYGLGETEASLGAKQRQLDDDPPTKSKIEQEAEKVAETLTMERARKDMMRKQADLFDHHYANPNSSFVDPKIYDDLARKDAQSQAVIHFFSALAFCHTVIPEINDPAKPHDIVYKAQSPDESALVATARDVGFTFVAREQDTVTIDAMGERRDMTLLNVLEFNSTRKRMSVILRGNDGQLVLLCKGADSVIYERLTPTERTSDDEQRIREQTLKDLAQFANEGLRTLCIASRVLSEADYQAWAKRYKDASNSIHNRDEQMEQTCEEIERELTLIGGTAIEDKLQEGVPDTIALLAKAGIKIWVLTGDKIETAINIGFACNLLTKDMLLLSVNARDEQDTLDQLRRSQEQVDHASGQKCALVIDGESLKYALEMPAKVDLLRLGTQCVAVVCCRVSPMQKAKVVNLVKKGLKVMTLSIGDGANDVSMIQEANVGVGISGEEGRQAVMASDYAIAQFRYLGKLLLVHGRWSYLRTSEMIFTFFYKNIMWTLVLFWYQLFCGFTGTMMFDYSYITLYNLVFTSLPCIFAGVLDQDLKAEYSFKYPQLYLMGIRNDKFKRSRFYLTVFDAIYQSAICFGVPYMVFLDGKMSSLGYDTEGVFELGTFIAGIAVVVANALVGFTIFSWTYVMILVIGLSSATFFIWTAIYSNVMSFNFYGEDILFREASFWLCLVVTFVICMLPRYVAKYYLHMHHPFDNDIIRETVLCNNSSSLSSSPSTWRESLAFGRKPSLLHKRSSRHRHRHPSHLGTEEEIPITLTRTTSDQSSIPTFSQFSSASTPILRSTPLVRQDSQPSSFDLPDDFFPQHISEEPAPLNPDLAHPTPLYARTDRTGMKAAGGHSEIMYMGSGKRQSFTGFAFSSDDASAFDGFRSAVYRGRRTSTTSVDDRFYGNNSFYPANATTMDLASSGVASADWMPLHEFKLRRYDTAPDPHQLSKRSTAGGLQWMRAVKERITPSSSKHSMSNDHELVDVSH